MKKIALLCFCLFIAQLCRTQNDSSKIYNSSQLKKGFYKNYGEYLDNAPSVTPEFTSILLFIKVKEDTVVTGAKYNTRNGAKIAGAWGFCDGTDVFINQRVSLFKKRFLKVQYIGKNPFFLFWRKDIYAIGTPLPALVTAAASAAATTGYDLMFINENGKVRLASYRNLKKLFIVTPDLRRKFTTERVFTNKIKTEYLVEYNEKFIQ